MYGTEQAKTDIGLGGVVPTVTGTGTMVTDGFPLGLVWFQDTSHVAVVLLCYSGGIV